jgi:hypothetical protein
MPSRPESHATVSGIPGAVQFDDYQSKENAKHTLRAMKENARQGYWNGTRPRKNRSECSHDR